MKEKLSKVITKVKEKTPLVQAITNYVTINDCANILLAYGASPAMVECDLESQAFAIISSALYINVGTLTKEQAEAMVLAATGAKQSGIPVVLDPVGCAAIPRKIEVINRIAKEGRIDIIKGNAGEIKFLAGVAAKARGVDSVDDGEGLEEACISLAKQYGCVVAVTGAIDIITDGVRVVKILNGTEMLTFVTGAGCMVGALCAGAAGAEEDMLVAAAGAVLAMNLAGEKACQGAKGPGTFKVNLMDEIYALTEGQFIEEGRIEWR